MTGEGTQNDIDSIEIFTRNEEFDEDDVTLVDAVGDFITVGEEFTDPAWATLRLAFTGLSEDVLSTGTETKVSKSGDDVAKLEFTHDKGRNIDLNIAEAYETGTSVHF